MGHFIRGCEVHMASKAPLGPFILHVIFEPREDGGLRARCDKVPNFLLSHSDPELVRADVEPALETILSEMFGHQMKVERLRDLDEALHSQLSFAANLCKQENYVGHAEAH